MVLSQHLKMSTEAAERTNGGNLFQSVGPHTENAPSPSSFFSQQPPPPSHSTTAISFSNSCHQLLLQQPPPLLTTTSVYNNHHIFRQPPPPSPPTTTTSFSNSHHLTSAFLHIATISFSSNSYHELIFESPPIYKPYPFIVWMGRNGKLCSKAENVNCVKKYCPGKHCILVVVFGC